jgi:hypothetical protein
MAKGAPGFFDVEERLAELSAEGRRFEASHHAGRFRVAPGKRERDVSELLGSRTAEPRLLEAAIKKAVASGL